ncbi:MAG: hypothetical protein QXI18_04730 [Nitrososphaerota archaeon]
MGFLTNFLQTTFNAAYGILMGAFVANLLVDAITAAIPNYFSGQASQLLSYISGLSLITFLTGLLHNPFFGAVVNGAALLGTMSGVSLLSNLSSATQTYAQTVFIVAYVTYVYTNALFLFADWVPLVVQGLIVAPVVMAFDYFLIGVFSVAEILYVLMALGYIPQGV